MEQVRYLISIRLIVLFLSVLVFNRCRNEDINGRTECHKVRLGIQYCGGGNTVLVFFDRANKYTSSGSNNDGSSPHYSAAITNFPMDAYKRDSVVYVRFRYDQDVEQAYYDTPRYCVAIFSKERILTFEGISEKSCVLAK